MMNLETFDSMIKLALIFLVFVVIGCSRNPPHIVEANRFIKEYSSCQKKEGFLPYGTGGAFFKQINQFNFDLVTPGVNVTIEEARKVLVEKTEELVGKVNQNERVRPYLKDYPFSEKNIYLRVVFTTPNPLMNTKDAIVMAGVGRGKVFYSIDGPMGFDRVYEEPYATAYEIVYGCPLPDRVSQIDSQGSLN
jgi:hypothetical protein